MLVGCFVFFLDAWLLRETLNIFICYSATDNSEMLIFQTVWYILVTIIYGEEKGLGYFRVIILTLCLCLNCLTICPCPNLKKIYSKKKKKKTNSTFLNELQSHPVSKYWKKPTNSKGKTGAESHNSATNTEVLHWHTLLLPSLTTEMYKSLPGSVHKNQYWTSFNSTDDKLHLWGKTSHKEGRGKSKKIWHQQNI